MSTEFQKIPSTSPQRQLAVILPVVELPIAATSSVIGPLSIVPLTTPIQPLNPGTRAALGRLNPEQVRGRVEELIKRKRADAVDPTLNQDELVQLLGLHAMFVRQLAGEFLGGSKTGAGSPCHGRASAVLAFVDAAVQQGLMGPKQGSAVDVAPEQSAGNTAAPATALKKNAQPVTEQQSSPQPGELPQGSIKTSEAEHFEEITVRSRPTRLRLQQMDVGAAIDRLNAWPGQKGVNPILTATQAAAILHPLNRRDVAQLVAEGLLVNEGGEAVYKLPFKSLSDLLERMEMAGLSRDEAHAAKTPDYQQP